MRKPKAGPPVDTWTELFKIALTGSSTSDNSVSHIVQRAAEIADAAVAKIEEHNV